MVHVVIVVQPSTAKQKAGSIGAGFGFYNSLLGLRQHRTTAPCAKTMMMVMENARIFRSHSVHNFYYCSFSKKSQEANEIVL
jgi:hypothetical protein